MLIEVETIQDYLDDFSTSAVFGPEGADSLWIEDKPRVFGSVSQNRVWLANRIWFQQPYIKFDDSNG